MEETKIKYPIGEQDFCVLREEGFCYIDKTAYIGKIKDGSKYVFLSSLQYFFEGRRELFRGLAVDSGFRETVVRSIIHGLF